MKRGGSLLGDINWTQLWAQMLPAMRTVVSTEQRAGMARVSLPSVLQVGAYIFCILLFCWCKEVVKMASVIQVKIVF
jgi:hypothetical protein